MAEDQGKEEAEHFEFDLPTRAAPNISLEEAVMLAYQYSRNNREIFGRYAQVELDWSFARAREMPEYHEIRLSYRPVRDFRGRSGVEQLTIDKTGQVLSRRIIRQPRTARTSLLVSSAGVAAVAVVALAALFGIAVLRPSSSSRITLERVEVTLIPDVPTRLESSGGAVVVDVPTGSVGAASNLIFRSLSPRQMPAIPPSFRPTNIVFDLTSNTPLLKPITIRAEISAGDAMLARGDAANIVMQHHRDGAWTQLDTKVDFGASTATVSVDHLSVFALTIKEPPADAEVPTSAAYKKGVAYYIDGEYQLAVDQFNLAIKQNPNISNYYWTRGNALLSLGNLPQAINDYTTAIDLDPENPTLLHLRGIAYRADGRLVEALGDLDEAIRLKPDYALAYNTRGYVYHTVGLEQKAKTNYNKACELDRQYCK